MEFVANLKNLEFCESPLGVTPKEKVLKLYESYLKKPWDQN